MQSKNMEAMSIIGRAVRTRKGVMHGADEIGVRRFVVRRDGHGLG
jgi:hypothetical protein